MKRLYKVKQRYDDFGEGNKYIATENGSFTMVDEENRYITFRQSNLKSLLDFEELTMDDLEPLETQE